MATTEQQSSHESYHEKGKTNATILDERRRAALSEIDNAPFSYVSKIFTSFLPILISYVGGSMSRSALSLV